MKKIYTLGLILSFFILFTKVNFAQTSHSVLVGPGGQFVFEPVNLTISTGDTVIWEWQSNNHSTTSDATSGDEVWDSGIRNNGATFSKVFTTLGTYPYHCTPHQALGMVGTITVQDFTGIDNHLEDIADKFVLKQNYPNPFNPSTKIKFVLPKQEIVTLEVFNTIGQKVKILLNQHMKAGQHELEFNGKNLASGVYYYQLIAGDFHQIKKMILLR